MASISKVEKLTYELTKNVTEKRLTFTFWEPRGLQNKFNKYFVLRFLKFVGAFGCRDFLFGKIYEIIKCDNLVASYEIAKIYCCT